MPCSKIFSKTIVSTSLPTITSDLEASQNQYTWVGVAYLLTQTACQPLYGRISDLVGRKVRRSFSSQAFCQLIRLQNLLYSSMAIFAIGSLLCGAAGVGSFSYQLGLFSSSADA